MAYLLFREVLAILRTGWGADLIQGINESRNVVLRKGQAQVDIGITGSSLDEAITGGYSVPFLVNLKASERLCAEGRRS